MFLIPSLNLGGAERVTVNLANQFSKKKYEVYVISLIPNGFYENELINDINLICLDIKRARNSIIPIYKLIKNYNPKYCISMTREINISCGIIFKLFNLNSKLIIREASPFYNYSINNKYLLKSVYLKILKFAYSSATGFIANSKLTLETYLNNNLISKKTEKTVIGNPIILNTSSKANKSNNQIKIKNKFSFVSIGRLHKVKDHKTLIKAFNIFIDKYPNAILRIYGEGPERGNLEKLVRKLNLNNEVFFMGLVKNPINHLLKSDIFILSSLHEGFGNVLVEAMYSKLKIICSDSLLNGSELVYNRNCFTFFKVGDFIDLSFKMTEVIRNENKFEESNYIHSLNYKSDIISKKYDDFLKKIIE